MARAIFFIASTEFQAESILHELKFKGIEEKEISVLFPDKVKDSLIQQSYAGQGQGSGLAGGTCGWLNGSVRVTICGCGPFIAAGPVLDALGGAKPGGTAEGISLVLQGMGMALTEAKLFESKVKSGRLLISVRVDDGADSESVSAILECAKAQDISFTCEVGVEDRKTDNKK